MARLLSDNANLRKIISRNVKRFQNLSKPQKVATGMCIKNTNDGVCGINGGKWRSGRVTLRQAFEQRVSAAICPAGIIYAPHTRSGLQGRKGTAFGSCSRHKAILALPRWIVRFPNGPLSGAEDKMTAREGEAQASKGQ